MDIKQLEGRLDGAQTALLKAEDIVDRRTRIRALGHVHTQAKEVSARAVELGWLPLVTKANAVMERALAGVKEAKAEVTKARRERPV